MGAYPNTYLGVYLIVPDTTKSVEHEIFVDPVSGKECKTLFNPSTGEKNEIKKVSKPKTIYASPYIYDDANRPDLDEDVFWSPEYGGDDNARTFLINKHNEFHIDLKDERAYEYDLENFNRSEMIAGFLIKYKPYLDFYTQKFGTVIVKCGIVHYYH